MKLDFKTLNDVLGLVNAAVDAAARAKTIYGVLLASAQQDKSLTPEESAQLDATAKGIFASEANKPSGR